MKLFSLLSHQNNDNSLKPTTIHEYKLETLQCLCCRSLLIINKHFEGSCELLRFDAFALPELLLQFTIHYDLTFTPRDSANVIKIKNDMSSLLLTIKEMASQIQDLKSVKKLVSQQCKWVFNWDFSLEMIDTMIVQLIVLFSHFSSLG